MPEKSCLRDMSLMMDKNICIYLQKDYERMQNRHCWFLKHRGPCICNVSELSMLISNIAGYKWKLHISLTRSGTLNMHKALQTCIKKECGFYCHEDSVWIVRKRFSWTCIRLFLVSRIKSLFMQLQWMGIGAFKLQNGFTRTIKIVHMTWALYSRSSQTKQ